MLSKVYLQGSSVCVVPVECVSVITTLSAWSGSRDGVVSDVVTGVSADLVVVLKFKQNNKNLLVLQYKQHRTIITHSIGL